MKRTVTGTVLLALLFLSFACSALRFESFDSENGLSHQSITDMTQDRYGFVWIGTEDGLNRFDGYHFKVFRKKSDNPYSISDNFVTSIAEDNKGNLWIATYSGGLNYFDRTLQQFTAFTNNAEDPDSLGNNRLYSAAFVDTEQLWLGTIGEVAITDISQADKPVFTRLTLPLDESSGLRKSRIVAIAKDFDEHVWLGTEGSGLYRYSIKDKSFEHFYAQSQTAHGVIDNNIQDVYLDSSNVLWLATGKGLVRYNRNEKRFVHFTHQPETPGSLSNDQVKDIVEDHKNRLWVATSNGLNRFDRTTEMFTRFMPQNSNQNSLTNGFVERLMVSKDNVLWAGLSTNGFNIANLNAEQFNLHRQDSNNPDSLGGNIIWTFAESYNGNLWIGTGDGGLNYFNRQTGTFSKFQHDKNDPNTLSSSRIYTVLETAPGKVWVGTVDAGLNFIDMAKNKITRYQYDTNDNNSLTNNTVLRIFQDMAQNLWVSTRSGLNRFVPEKQHFVRYLHDENDPTSLGDNLVGDIYQSDAQTLWFATAGSGLNRLDLTTQKFQRFTHNRDKATSIASNAVMAITQGAQGKLWLATMAGLDRFDIEKQTFEHVLKGDYAIYSALQASQDQVWFSTNQGLGKLNPQNDEIQWFDVKDGLQNNEFNFGAHLKTRDGRLVFGGISGFNDFNPNLIEVEQQPLSVTLTDLKLFNKAVAVGQSNDTEFTLEKSIYLLDELTLSHRENLLTLSFSSLDFVNPDSVAYQYQLVGIDDDWIDADPLLASATYTNLASGSHNFLVRAKSKNGIWGEPTSLAITVNPPPWLSWWALLLYLTLIALIVGDFFYQRHLKFKAMEESGKQLTQMNEQLDDLVNQRTAQLSETLEALKNTQDDLIESKKMASLMGVVVGVAHEMNTPLGIATTALSRLRLDVDLLNEKLESKQLSRNDLSYFTQAGMEALDLAGGNLHRAGILVNKFKALSEQSHQQQTQQIGLAKLLQQVIDGMHGKLSNNNAKVILTCPDGLYLHTYPTILAAVFEQLIENSVLHAGSDSDGKPLKITIEGYSQEKAIHIIYADNGNGLESEEEGQLFEPFYTTKRGTDCTGLGMSIVYNQITQHLGGTISYKSSPGLGLTLKITLGLSL